MKYLSKLLAALVIGLLLGAPVFGQWPSTPASSRPISEDLKLFKAPSSLSAPGRAGYLAYDATYFYVYDPVTRAWIQIGGGGGGGSTSDTAYNATTWDAVTTVSPSKNAVRDQLETMLASIGAKQTSDAALTALAAGSDFVQFSGPATSTKIKTLRDAADTILELGGSYTPTGTWNWQSITGTWPTFNQNTTGSAATLTTARTINGVSFNGSANITVPAAGSTLSDNVPVTLGGTGRSTSTTAYGLIAAGTTATGAHQTLAAGATTEILVGGGAGALPAWTTATGSGAPVRATSPTLVTPALGVATATSLNGHTFTAGSSVFTGTAGQTYTFPATTSTLFSTTTKTDVLQTADFASDAGANDTYTATYSPAVTAYVTGARYRFKANTANTGAATVNLNALGAKTIVKLQGAITTTLADNDIRAGQWVECVYDGTNMQMVSALGNSPSASITGTDTYVTFFDGANNPAGDAGMTYNKTTDSLTLVGSITTGSGASTAGALVLTQGTTQSTGATNITVQAPTSVTSYIRTLPSAVGSTGFLLETVSGSTQTESLVAGTGTGSVVRAVNPTVQSPVYTVAAVGASAIDWNAADTHTKTLAANTTFTFSNAATGKQIVVAVTNTASNYTVTWPTVSWSGGAAPTQTVGVKTDIYTFIQIGSTIYGSVVQNF